MKKKASLIITVILALFSFTGAASAVTLVAAPFEFSGNSNPESEEKRLVDAIAKYNLLPVDDLPGVSSFLEKRNGGPKKLTLNLESFQNTYILFKYAKLNTIYYIGEETGLFDFKFLDLGGKEKELSHYSIFRSVVAPRDQNPVSDGGGSVALLGLGLTGVAAAARKFREKAGQSS